MIRRRVVVHGRVQGVFFRDTCRQRAEAEGVTGSVRNASDGTVVAYFEGDDDAVGRLCEWCEQGPPSAQVSHVEVIREEPQGVTRFDVW